MKALVTGCEPFGSELVNPALEALGRLPPRLGALAIETRMLPAVFGEALDVLEEAVRAATPDIVLCVGLAGGRAALSLERVAINIDDARIPDNKGRQPIDLPVVAGGPAAYFTTLPIKAAVAALRGAARRHCRRRGGDQLMEPPGRACYHLTGGAAWRAD